MAACSVKRMGVSWKTSSPHLFIGDPARGIEAYGEEIGCGVGEVGARWPLWLVVLLPLGLVVYRKVLRPRLQI